MSERPSHTSLSAILDIAVDGIIVLDERFRIVRYSVGAQRIFGWTETELMGEPLDRLLPPSVWQVHRSHMQSFATGASSARTMAERRAISGVRKNGQEFPAEASIARSMADGSPIFMVMVRDISARRRVEDEQRMLATAGWALAASLDIDSTLATIAEMPIPLLADWTLVELFSEEGEVRRAAASHVDEARGADVGPLLSVHPEPLPASLAVGSSARVAHAGSSHRFDPPEPWLNGTLRTEKLREHARALGVGSVVVAPLRAGSRVIGALNLIRKPDQPAPPVDDTATAEQFAAIAALALENTRLYQESRQAVRDRDDLLAIVSHDLRNPVNAIAMLTGGLMAQSDAGAPVTVELEQLQIVRGAARQADGLIQDLQDVSRITAGRLQVHLQPSSLSALLEETLELFQVAAADAGISLINVLPDALPEVLADAQRVQQVLSNLLGNAVKFTPAGGEVRLSAVVVPSESKLQLTIQDTGPGIDPADVPRLFERYWQAPRLLRSGSGLGLFIAKGIIEAHRGTMEVQTAVGEGLRISFSLQIA